MPKLAAKPAPAHSSFEFLGSSKIDALQLEVEQYRHRATGAMHYHLAADNDENVFLVALRTVPMDSRGVAHILEHTALCGSKRFPVRDPFFMMIRRSLNTFMNAFTSSDWTAYPFASQNRKDFFNLLDVYLDAVFFARLDELDFAQEGHRIEFAEAKDSQSDLVYKGVVFNEMKGAMSSSTSILWHTLCKHLFPSTTYHYNSGGEPEQIPELSYAQLKDFYKTHYHPSNAIFMTYGQIPALEHQTMFEEKALSHFKPLDKQISVPAEQRYLAPVNVEEFYPVDEEQGETQSTHIVLSWLLGESMDLETQLRMHLLSGVLLDDGASPLRLALESSDLGKAPSPLCGLDDSSREMVFACGLEGSEPQHAQAVEDMVFAVFNELAEKGVAQDRLEAVLHQLELHQREIGGDSYPYGLQIILHGLTAATHRGDVSALLNLEPVLEKLRQDIKQPDFIQNLVKQALIDNMHRVRLCLRPDLNLANRRIDAEKNKLAAIKAKLSKPELEKISQLAEALAERQLQQDDADILPKVGLEDVPADTSTPTAQQQATAAGPLAYYSQGTNGLVYQQVITDLPDLSDELLSVLPQFGHCYTELGCGDLDYLQTQMWQSRVSGGVGAGTSVRSAIDDVKSLSAHFVVSGKALQRNAGELSELLHASYNDVKFAEHQRIREIISQERVRREQSVTGSGHVLAMLVAASGFSAGSALSNRWQGMLGIKEIKALDERVAEKAGIEALAAEFESIQQQLLNSSRKFLIVAESNDLQEFEAQLNETWQPQSKAATAPGWSYASPTQVVRQLWVANTQINFCAKAYATVPYQHPDAAVLTVLGGFLRNGYLHRAIREQGGAYGGGAAHDNDNGVFRFYSYRDPRLQETLTDFDAALDWLASSKHEARFIEEAILGVIGALDKPSSPAGEAKKAYFNELYARSSDVRAQFRQRVLAVTLADLQRVAETYLRADQAGIAVITGAKQAAAATSLGLEVNHL